MSRKNTPEAIARRLREKARAAKKEAKREKKRGNAQPESGDVQADLAESPTIENTQMAEQIIPSAGGRY